VHLPKNIRTEVWKIRAMFCSPTSQNNLALDGGMCVHSHDLMTNAIMAPLSTAGKQVLEGSRKLLAL